MGSVLGSIFGFGNKLKRNLRESVSNPSGYMEEIANNLEYSRQHKNPEISGGQLWKRPLTEDEKITQSINNGLGFLNPVPLGTMGNFAFRKALEDAVPSMSRRDFLKKSGGIAAGAATAGVVPKLLRKFAAEEKPIADAVAQTAKEAPKYKYNSLKEYLDDAQMWAKEDFKAAELSRRGARYSKDEFFKRQLLNDELAYKTAKENLARPNPRKDFKTGLPPQSQVDRMNAFSPQAKKEMSAWKEMRGRGWENIDEYSRGEIGRGLFPNHNGSLVKNPANDTYHHYMPGQEGRLSEGFNSLDESRDALTKLLQETWRNKTRTGF